MAKISSYDNASPVSLTDKIIGTSVGAVPANATKNFLLSDIQSLFNLTTNTLSNVLTAGNTATNNIVLTGNISCTDIAATGAVNAASSAITGIVNAGTITTPGSITGNSAAITTTVTATTVTASGVITGGTVTSTGTVNANRVVVANNVEAVTANLDIIAPKGATNQLSVSGILSFANNAAAKQPTGPLVAGNLYITDGTGAAPLNVAGILMVVV